MNIITCHECKRWMGFATAPVAFHTYCLRCRKPHAPMPARIKPLAVQLELFPS